MSLRWRITLPFLLLALLLGLGASYLVIRLLRETSEERFLRQLANSGQLATDAVVRVESDMLEGQRLVANTDGVLTATVAGNAEELRGLVLPLVVNVGIDAVAVVDDDGLSLLSIRRNPAGGAGAYETVRGEAIYTDWPAVASTLAILSAEPTGDKEVGLGRVQSGGLDRQILFVVGPLRLTTGRVAGAVLVGEYLPDLASRVAEASGGNITFYDLLAGQVLATSIEGEIGDGLQLSDELITAAVTAQDETTVRQTQVAGIPYREALIPLTARQGEVLLGVMGISLIDAVSVAQDEASTLSSDATTRTVVGYGAAALFLIGIAGLVISYTITRPLVDIATASQQVAQGNLDVQVPERGGGEVTVVARSFNQMVRGLRKAGETTEWESQTDLPRALLGSFEAETRRLAEAEIADLSLLAFALQEVTPVTRLSPEETAARAETVIEALEAVIAPHRGYLAQFDGQLALVAFGMPPDRQPRQVSAMLSVHAAFAGLEALRRLDLVWRAEGAGGLNATAVAHAGQVIVGEVGQKYGLPSLLLGDTVKETLALVAAVRQLEQGGILVSQSVHDRLAGAASHFVFGRSGQLALRSLGRELMVNEVSDRRLELVK
ncbi:MAG TPA: HAMP domain-containing protein [Anaerolineales bacterium]